MQHGKKIGTPGSKEGAERQKKMRILDCMERFPGGMVVIPMFATALVNTLFPRALEIGGVTTALFKDGSLAIIGMLLFFFRKPAQAFQSGNGA